MSNKASEVITASRLVKVFNHALHPTTFFITPDPSVPTMTVRVCCAAAQKVKGKKDIIPGCAETEDYKTKKRSPMLVEMRHIEAVRKTNAIVDGWFTNGELVCRAA